MNLTGAGVLLPLAGPGTNLGSSMAGITRGCMLTGLGVPGKTLCAQIDTIRVFDRPSLIVMTHGLTSCEFASFVKTNDSMVDVTLRAVPVTRNSALLLSGVSSLGLVYSLFACTERRMWFLVGGCRNIPLFLCLMACIGA